MGLNGAPSPPAAVSPCRKWLTTGTRAIAATASGNPI